MTDLRNFYYRTQLGRRSQQAIQARLRALWPRVAGETVAGFGFAAPFLRPFLGEARRVLCLMPAAQGVMPWPAGGPNVSILAEETAWPVPAGFLDRLVVAHGLETCDRPGALLDEIWRVLAPQGRVVFVLPNRTGLWARRDATPFGYGRPYTWGQITAQLARHQFVPAGEEAALYGPPSHRPFWLRTAPLWEGLGQRLASRRLAGAILVEATKQTMLRPQRGLQEAARSPLGFLEGLARPPRPARVAAEGGPRLESGPGAGAAAAARKDQSVAGAR